MQQPIIVREATHEDLDKMKSIWIEFIDYHAGIDSVFERSRSGHECFGQFVSERIDKPEWRVLVAEIDDKIVGHIMGTIQSRPPVFKSLRFGYVQDIAVRSAFRRRGVGTQLFEHLVQWYKSESVHRIELDVVTANDVSNSFWKKVGCRDLMTRYSLDL